MPIDPLSLALMTVNVGASIFNNWRNNKQSYKLQEKQQEFARASTERTKQRMWQLMREGQELALEMERESHENRLEDIRNDFDRILHRFAYIETIKTWPLNVLPIVMKNQSLGSLTATADENIAMHCILTPSNCVQFNKYILPTIEEKLTDFCNLHWSTLSSHPILFYSGAWKTGTIPTGVEISQLKTNLNNLPTLLITPFFKPKGGIVFLINAWGIGVELETEIECVDFSYAESYKQSIDYLQEEDIKERTIEEFIPYLQCLIGYIADQYFWTNHNESPLLPTLLVMNAINTDGMQYLNTASEERYSNLLDVCIEESLAMPFSPEKMLCLFEGSTTLWDNTTRKVKLEEIFITNAQGRSKYKITSMKDALSYGLYSKEDIPFLRKFIQLYQYNDYKNQLSNLLGVLENINFDYSILESTDIAYLEKLANENNGAAIFRLGEIYEYSIGIKWNDVLSKQYYKCSSDLNFLLALLKSDIAIYDQYQRELECLIDSGVSQALLFKIIKSCNNTQDEIVLLCNDDCKKHPGISYIKANILLNKNNDSVLIEQILTHLANSGYIKAQELLSKLYKDGDILVENPQKHAHYAEMAMLQNSPYATYAMALCYLNGYGEQQSTNAALMLIDKAEELGYAEARRIKSLLSSI